MSYRFLADRQYLMPTHFGPMTGPRHDPEGARFPQPDSRTMEIYQTSYVTEKPALETLLPPGFELVGSPTVTIAAQYMHNIAWLAGRGYNTLGVSVRARFAGVRDRVEGRLLLVLWENLVEPILTGREQLGFAKIYCDLPPVRRVGREIFISGAWGGHKFFDFTVADLQTVDAANTAPEGGDCILNLRYVPDVDQLAAERIMEVTCTPIPHPNPSRVEVRLQGKGAVRFLPTSWSDMPTQHRIVEALRSLPITKEGPVSYIKGIGARDADNVRTLK